MKLIKKIESGVLPYNNSDLLLISQAQNNIDIFDINLNKVSDIEGFKVRGINSKFCLLLKGRQPYLYDFSTHNLIDKISSIQGSASLIDKGVLFNSRHISNLEYFDLQTFTLKWSLELNYHNRLYGFTTCNDVLIGNVYDSNRKFGINIVSGEFLWELDSDSMGLGSQNSYVGKNHSTNGILLAINEQEIIRLNELNGNIIWYLNLDPMLKMGSVIHGTKMYLFVREVNDVFYLEIDLETGEIVNKVLLTEVIQRLKIYPKDNTGLFGQLNYFDNKIIFGANNKLIQLDLSNYKMEVVYDHEAEFYFSKIIGTKLFFTDDKSNTLVFELAENFEPS